MITEEHKTNASMMFTTVSGGATALGDWFNYLNDHAGAVGALCTVLGLCVTTYYARKENRRKQEKHLAELEQIRKER